MVIVVKCVLSLKFKCNVTCRVFLKGVGDLFVKLDLFLCFLEAYQFYEWRLDLSNVFCLSADTL